MHVANGIYEESLKQHHTKPIPPDLGVVTLVEIIVVDALLPIPEPSCRVLKDAKGYFLLWPRRLIVVESFNESEPTNLCPPSIRKRKLSTLQPQKAQHNVVEVDEMPSFVKLLFTKLSGHSHFLTYNFAAPKPIFGVGKLVTVCWVDFIDMCRLNMLPDTIMSLYQWLVAIIVLHIFIFLYLCSRFLIIPFQNSMKFFVYTSTKAIATLDWFSMSRTYARYYAHERGKARLPKSRTTWSKGYIFVAVAS